MSTLLDDLVPHAAAGETPRRIFRETMAQQRLEHVANVRDALARPPVEVLLGFSFKTNPRRELVTLARRHGFFAETIARDEVEWAAQVGFPPAETIYNGPEPLLDRQDGERLGLAYADSIEAFVRNVQLGIAHVHGVRLRPSMIASRFGVALEDDADLHDAVRGVPEDMPIAVSFHARRQDFNGASWRDVAADVLGRAAAIERRTRRRVVAFDVGGGWTPDQFDERFVADMRWVLDRIAISIPHCTRLIAEPGQAVCTPTEAIVAEVLEVRERRGRREAIVDVGYEDWPEMHSYVHRLFIWRGETWEALGRGPDRLGGRTCLEYDFVDGLHFPVDLAPGNRLLILDTGSYDHSMSFRFARGEGPHRTLAD